MEKSHESNSHLPKIKVKSITTSNPNDIKFEFEPDENFINFLKKERSVDFISDDELNEYIKNLIYMASNKIDGYNFKKTTKDVDN